MTHFHEIQITKERQRQLQLQLCEQLGLNPEQVSDIAIISEPDGVEGSETAHVMWTGHATIPKQQVIDLMVSLLNEAAKAKEEQDK